ncbi:MAG: hypothetical protein JST81_02005 [Bacteroidetes bacterium]|nr:hypothetical protein [Bacteroidota bacterium]
MNDSNNGVLFLILMSAFLVLTFVSTDETKSQLFASLGIISGVCASKFISTQNKMNNEEY